MSDPRLEAYARILVERCVNVKPGWQVIVRSTHLARPLLEEVARQIARRGAFVLPQYGLETVSNIWMQEASDDLVAQVAPLQMHVMMNADAIIGIDAPENTRAGAETPSAKRQLQQKATFPFSKRLMTENVPWVVSQFPTPALAQDAGMSLPAFEEFLYGAVLLDWDAETAKMQRIADRFDRAETVRIVGEATDLTLSLKGRKGIIDGGHRNMPGGEVFYSPVEDSAHGVITYSEFPAMHGGREVEGIRLVFRHGKVVEASADRNEEALLKALETDEGAKFLGELGIGCNPGVTRYMRNTLFDEKIYGTIHLAVGNGFPEAGGTNESALHWDMVKDLRQGGKLYCDGQLVQENGQWVF